MIYVSGRSSRFIIWVRNRALFSAFGVFITRINTTVDWWKELLFGALIPAVIPSVVKEWFLWENSDRVVFLWRI